MKKIIMLLILTITLVGIVSCGSEDSSSGTSSTFTLTGSNS